ncbi:MAG: SMC-Scp complex subunit ScpB [Clostridia bacterium]|nr:SMC-Scp complex subunit ScpB [Clostridia bacterium]
MKEKQTEAKLQAMLFASGESVPVKRMAEVLELGESKVFSILEKMREEYEKDSSSGIRLVQLEDCYQLCTKKEYYECIRTLTEKKRKASLTNAGLEVLSIVAYNQPITRSSIEFIRGVNSDGPLNNLISAGLVEEVGRLDAPGRPILFGTGEEFLRCFDLSSIADLPDVELEYNFEDLNRDLVEAEQIEFDTPDSQKPEFEIKTDDVQASPEE